MMISNRLALLAVGIAVPFSAAPRALAQDAAASAQSSSAPVSKAECAEAYESAQESRASGLLRKTRERLDFCAQAECPNFVQRDCSRWLTEVDRELPTVRISARAWDEERATLRVTLDGQALAPAATKAAIALDPGRHDFVFERTGHAPITRTILAQQGIQNRVLIVDFEPAVANADVTVDASASSSSLRPYAYAAWAVGAVGIGTFAILGTLGRSDKRALKDDCTTGLDDDLPIAPGACTTPDFNDRQNAYDRTFLFADIGLVTGLLGLAGGTALFLLAPGGASQSTNTGAARAAQPRVSVDLGVLQGGARAAVGGHF